jgi:hypothetical protein
MQAMIEDIRFWMIGAAYLAYWATRAVCGIANGY